MTIGIAKIVNHQLRTMPGERERVRPAQSLTRACNDGHLAIQPDIHHCSLNV
jgi:hypothetical protein